jgi:pimeloyl-ACP methyl ester carboxylesterase
MVLVDSAHEEQLQRFPEAIRAGEEAMLEAQVQQFAGVRSMIESGSIDPSVLPVPPTFPDEAAATYRALISSSTVWLDTLVAELQAVEESHAQLRAAGVRSLGDIPLVALRHGKPIPPMPPETGVGLEDMSSYEDVWQQIQEELAALSSRGKVVVAEQAGHMIHQDQPGLVVDAVREVVDAVRSST